MNRRNLILAIGAAAVAGFGGLTLIYKRQTVLTATPAQESNTLVRPHAPVIGPADARVTIVEFFDPACNRLHDFTCI